MVSSEFAAVTKICWLIGIAISVICLLIQILSYILVPSSRKLDLKILTHITVARIVNVAVEFVLRYLENSRWVKIVAFTLLMHTDCVLICWMCVFSKNLYDKVVRVFTNTKIPFVMTSVLIWLLSLPVGILCPVLLARNDVYLKYYYYTYIYTKFIILSVNLLLFCGIIYVAVKRNISASFRRILKTCVMLFILVSISSVQVLLSDLVSYFDEKKLQYVFCAINSYQVLPVMIIFVILARGSAIESARNMSIKEPNVIVMTP